MKKVKEYEAFISLFGVNKMIEQLGINNLVSSYMFKDGYLYMNNVDGIQFQKWLVGSTMSIDMYKEYINNYNNYVSPRPEINNTNNELLKKLDNILYLLEEQKEEQSHLITEELILYVFLGVFVIYVLDSFVRVGKYVR